MAGYNPNNLVDEKWLPYQTGEKKKERGKERERRGECAAQIEGLSFPPYTYRIVAS